MTASTTADRPATRTPAHCAVATPTALRHRELTPELAHAQRMARYVARSPGRGRGDLRDDLHSTAMLAYFETRQRHDERRGVPPVAHAYLRMRGSVLDLLAAEQRERYLTSSGTDAETTLNTERVRARVTVERLLQATAPEITGDEHLVLREVYLGGRTLADVGDGQGWSRSQTIRRNQSLIDRLRRAAGVETVRSRAVASEEQDTSGAANESGPEVEFESGPIATGVRTGAGTGTGEISA